LKKADASVSRDIVIGHSSTNLTINIDTIQFWADARDIAFSTALALYFGLHGASDEQDVHEINGC
jgi:hypothetical protein